MTAILQKHLPFAPWMQEATARLPGVQPVEMQEVLQVDEAYSAQMAEKARLMDQHRGDVLAMLDEAEAPARELLALVLGLLGAREDFAVHDAQVRRPDGVCVKIDPDAPMESLGRLVQEDIAILCKRGDEHVLSGALICFPASWSLSEKIGRPLSTVHAPVSEYDAQMALRVQRLFDAVRVGQPLMRGNALDYVDPELFQPRRAREDKPVRPGAPRYLRSERQTLLRLPETQAVVFFIHSYVLDFNDLSEAQRATWMARAKAP